MDSGTWSAFVVLDFDGHVVAVKSGKNWPPAAFLRELSAFSPTIVACDTRPPTKAAKKIASFFSARLFYPPRHSLTLLEKLKLAEGVKANAHERDALAAATKAFNSVASNKMRQLTRRFKEKATDKAKALVLQGVRSDKAVEQ